MFSLVVVLVLSGCSTLTSLNPVGTDPLQIEKDDWEGVWYGGGGDLKIVMVCFVMVKNKDKGILRVAFIREHKDEKKKDFVVKKLDIQLRQSKSALFGNFPLKDYPKDYANDYEISEINEESYVWFMIKRSEDSIVIKLPDPHEFEELVKEEKLKGKIEEKSIVITEPTDKITEFIDSSETDKLFGWHKLTLRRIAKSAPSIPVNPFQNVPQK